MTPRHHRRACSHASETTAPPTDYAAVTVKTFRNALCLLSVLTQATHAGLEWGNTEFVRTAKPDEQQVTATFSFTNTGKDRVTITNVKTSCGCSTPKLEKTVYGPGESGHLDVLFRFGSRIGQQTKTATVYTDEHAANPQKLTLRVDIPQPFKAWPKLVHWRATENPTPKKIRVQFNHTQPAKLVEIQTDQNLIMTEIATIEPGRLYDVILTPTLTDQPRPPLIPITLVSDLPFERTRVQKVYARVPQTRSSDPDP